MEKNDSQDNPRDFSVDFVRDFGRPETDLERELISTFADALHSSDSIVNADFSAVIELLEEKGSELEQNMRQTIINQFIRPLSEEELNFVKTAETKELSISRHKEILERLWNRPLTEAQKLTVRNIWATPNFLAPTDYREVIDMLQSWRNLDENEEGEN